MIKGARPESWGEYGERHQVRTTEDGPSEGLTWGQAERKLGENQKLCERKQENTPGKIYFICAMSQAEIDAAKEKAKADAEAERQGQERRRRQAEEDRREQIRKDREAKEAQRRGELEQPESVLAPPGTITGLEQTNRIIERVKKPFETVYNVSVKLWARIGPDVEGVDINKREYEIFQRGTADPEADGYIEKDIGASTPDSDLGGAGVEVRGGVNVNDGTTQTSTRVVERVRDGKGGQTAAQAGDFKTRIDGPVDAAVTGDVPRR
jgi:hypothetical protein